MLDYLHTLHYSTFTLHYIYITFTLHLHYDYITFTVHLHCIPITFTLHLHCVYVTITLHLHDITLHYITNIITHIYTYIGNCQHESFNHTQLKFQPMSTSLLEPCSWGQDLLKEEWEKAAAELFCFEQPGVTPRRFEDYFLHHPWAQQTKVKLKWKSVQMILDPFLD